MNRDYYLVCRHTSTYDYNFFYEAHKYFQGTSSLEKSVFFKMMIEAQARDLISPLLVDLIQYFDNHFELKILFLNNGHPVLMY